MALHSSSRDLEPNGPINTQKVEASGGFQAVDINAATETVTLSGIEAAETIYIFADCTGSAHAELTFYDAAEAEVGPLTNTDTTDLDANAQGRITAEVSNFTASKVDIDFVDDSGAANASDGVAIAR